MLAYWNKRLAGLNPKSPAYESLKSNILQLEFAIADSKSDLAYRQGKITDEQRAQFFLDWSNRVPKDSELWRTLQKNAAQFMEAVKRNGEISAKKAAAEARTRADADTVARYEAAADFVTAEMTRVARRLGLIPGINPRTGSAGTLADMGLNTSRGGIMQMPAVLAELSSDPRFMARLRELDPSFADGGVITQSYLEKIFNSKITGLTERRDRAYAVGDMTGDNGAVRLDEEIGKQNEWARIVGALPVGQAYESARKQWLKIWQDPNAGPTSKLAAWEAYRQTLVRLADEADPQTATALIAEATGDVSTDSLHENFTRIASPTATGEAADKPSGDIADTWKTLGRLSTENQMIASGAGILAYGKISDGQFVASAGGNLLGVAQIGQAQMIGGQAVPVLQPDGSVVQMWVTPQNVTVVARQLDGTNNRYAMVDSNNQVVNSVVAKAYVIRSGGTQTIYYEISVPNAKGQLEKFYTQSNPWEDGAVVNFEGNGIVVDISRLIAENPNFLVPKVGYDGRALLGPDGLPQYAVNIDKAWSASRNAAGLNYWTDTTTLISSVMRSFPPDVASKIADAIQSDPARFAMSLSGMVDANGNIIDKKRFEDWAVTLAVVGKQEPPSTMQLYDNTNNESLFVPRQATLDQSTGFGKYYPGAPTPISSVMPVPGRLAEARVVDPDTGSYVSVSNYAAPTPQQQQSPTVPALKVPRLDVPLFSSGVPLMMPAMEQATATSTLPAPVAKEYAPAPIELAPWLPEEQATIPWTPADLAPWLPEEQA